MRIELLIEAPLPDEWDKAKFAPGVNHVDRIMYLIKQKAKAVGRGSSRVAIKHKYKGRDTVIKVAINNSGIEQNLKEIKFLSSAAVRSSSLFVPIIDWDKEHGNNPLWIQTEFCEPSAGGIYGEIDPNEVDRLHSIIAQSDPDSVLENLMDEREYAPFKSQLSNKIIDFFTNNPELAESLTSDLLNDDNWGIYNGRLVLLDVGIDSYYDSDFVDIRPEEYELQDLIDREWLHQ